jgi:lipopolysaccharide transport system permease protein
MIKERLFRLYSSRRILWDMTTRQLKANYAGSFLGIWWAVVTPLLLAVSINFIFTAVFKISIANYYLFVLAGIIPWTFLVNTLNEAANSFIVNRAIIKQSVFPKELIPLSCVLAYLLNFLIGFIFMLPLFAAANFKVVSLLAVLFLLVMLQFLFVCGLGMLFSCLNIFWPDLRYLLSVLFMVWFWVTPVFYSLEMIPFPLRWVCLLNPVTHYVTAYQKVLFEARLPALPDLYVLFFISLVFAACGYIFFVKNEAQLLKKI